MVASINQRLLTMLDGAILTDVLFVIQGEEIKCHKLILSSFESRLKELVANNPKKIDIDDVSPHTFREILKYIYADAVVVTASNVFELMHASQKFALTNLEHSCSEFIENKLTELNVSFFTGQALQFDAKESLQVCLEYFKMNTLKVLSTKQFLEIPQKALLMLCVNKNAECRESRLFTACNEWAKEECKRQNLEPVQKNLRNVLGEDVVSQIQFQKMTFKEFFNIVVPSRILTYEEFGRHLVKFQGRMIEVAITDYNGIETVISRPGSCSIQELKNEKIWNGGQEQYSAEKFTLSHKGKTLQDDTTLADLFTPGEELSLLVNSVEVILYIGNQGVQINFTLNCKNNEKDIRKFICSYYPYHGFDFDDPSFSNPRIVPGSTLGYLY